MRAANRRSHTARAHNVAERQVASCSSSRSLFWNETILVARRFSLVPILSRKGLLAIAAVVDVALQKDGQPISAKSLAARHGLASRHLETVLQSLVRGGILKGFRGPHGGYLLARDRHGVTWVTIGQRKVRLGQSAASGA